jgi:hypothetical protein
VAQSGLNIGIIVNVPGATVSGTLVGRDAWLDELVRVSADISEDAGVFATGIRQAFTDDEVLRSIGEEITYDFLHLRDAYFVSGAGGPHPD